MNLKKISGYHLKYIALFSMFLDHIGVIGKAFLSKNVYFLLRAVGRLSFPLFCFILAEGFFHTKNRKKYQQRLFIFALLSEIPYDLAFHYLPASTLNSVLHLQKLSLTDFSTAFQEQNVLFTLFLGFTAMILMENASQYRQNAASVKFFRPTAGLPVFCASISFIQSIKKEEALPNFQSKQASSELCPLHYRY